MYDSICIVSSFPGQHDLDLLTDKTSCHSASSLPAHMSIPPNEALAPQLGLNRGYLAL